MWASNMLKYQVACEKSRIFQPKHPCNKKYQLGYIQNIPHILPDSVTHIDIGAIGTTNKEFVFVI